MTYQPRQPIFPAQPKSQPKASPFAPRPFPDPAPRTAQREAMDEEPPPPATPLSGEVTGAGEALVQRAVGFEFETGWLVTKEEKGAKGETVQKPLKKKDPVGVGGHAGFTVEADEAINEASEVEFVVQPPVPVARGGLATLKGVMTGLTDVGGMMKAAGSGGAAFSLSTATGRQADAPWRITPGDAEMKAGPQVTAGLLLKQLSKLGDDNKEAPLPDGFRRTRMTAESIKQTIESLDRSKVELPDEKKAMSEELGGLLSVVLSYLQAGESRGLEYPKQIADAFLLARTDCAQMFKMLPKREKDFFQQNAGHWVNLVMQLAKTAEIAGSSKDPVILHGVRPNPSTPHRPVGPTREMWLIYMTKGADLLSGPLDEELESMGAMESKTEKVGPDDEAAPIFELRGAQTAKIPLSSWKAFALQTFKSLLFMQNPADFKAESKDED